MIILGLNMFLISSLLLNFEISSFRNFGPNLVFSYFEIHRFNFFNQILLSLFDISSAFHNNI